MTFITFHPHLIYQLFVTLSPTNKKWDPSNSCKSRLTCNISSNFYILCNRMWKLTYILHETQHEYQHFQWVSILGNRNKMEIKKQFQFIPKRHLKWDLMAQNPMKSIHPLWMFSLCIVSTNQINKIQLYFLQTLFSQRENWFLQRNEIINYLK